MSDQKHRIFGGLDGGGNSDDTRPVRITETNPSVLVTEGWGRGGEHQLWVISNKSRQISCELLLPSA